MKSITLPEWFVCLPDDAWIDSEEILMVFGYSPKSHVSELIKRGSLPKVDEVRRVSAGFKNKWRVFTIRNFIKNKCEY